MRETLPLHVRFPARRVVDWRVLTVVAALVPGAGCAVATTAQAMRDGQRVVVEGRVASVDRAPMAYDGDGLLVLDTATHGEVTVHIAARRNLCQASGLDLFNAATVGMRLQASGSATGPADLSVCRDAADYLQARP